eukprot:TRINITY_DN464_c0_g1_i1.p1 TRINITY_DN464_c0_g1~~TRINITY_DN464_c0_g1_i1.p1  ORF type:complete len:1070 (-),score=255.19 TRINITY_DN464_c0_g1_i1:188-3088(-)
MKNENQTVTPVFLLWWFGSHAHYSHKLEELEPEIPSYMSELKRFVKEVVSTYTGPVYIVLDPEYNIGFLRKNVRFGLLMAEAAEILREEASVLPRVDLKVGLGIGDFGNKLRISEEKEWDSYRPSLAAAAPSMDFISFTQMPRQYDAKREKWMCESKDEKEWDIVHKNLPTRALALARWIKQKFDRPSMFHYYSTLYKSSTGDMVHSKILDHVKILAKSYLDEGLFAVAPLDSFDDHSGNLHHDGFWCESDTKAGILPTQPLEGREVKLMTQNVAQWTSEKKAVNPTFPPKPAIDMIFTKRQQPTNATVAILALNPSSGLATGGTRVTIVGRGFNLNNVTPYCYIAGVRVNATVITDSIAVCVTPQSPGILGAVNFAFSPNAALQSPPVSFQYYLNTPMIGFVFPTSASTIGGTPVTIRGANFAFGFNLRCQFGPLQPVVATFTGGAPDEIVCISPKTLRARDVNLRVLYNGATLSPPVRFELVWPVPTISKVVPSTGSIVGGQEVTVFGINFNDYFYAWCKFGQVYPTDAQVVQYSAYTRVKCPTAPGSAIGCVNLTVTNDGAHYSNPVQFCYTPEQPVLTSIAPSFGPVNIKTNVVVTGERFGSTLPSFCLFGRVGYSPAQVFNSTTAQCASPLTTVFNSGLHNFTFVQQLNGTAPSLNDSVLGDFRFSPSVSYAVTNTLRWNYTLPAPFLTSLTPSSGPQTGGTQVTIYGSGFITYNYTGSASLLCFFGLNSSPVTVLTETSIRCDSPASSFVGTVRVAVGYDQFSLSNSLNFTYLSPPPKVNYLDPPSGPVYGGNPVIVYGVFNRFQTYFCDFGTDTVQALSVRSDSLVCVAPPAVNCLNPENVTALYDGLVPFTVRQENGTSSLKLWYRYYIPTPVVVDAIPASGVYGTPVTVRGKDFFPGAKLRCQFGGDLYSIATKVDEYSVTCLVPPRKRGSFPGVVPLRVTNDLVNFSDPIPFTILQ